MAKSKKKTKPKPSKTKRPARKKPAKKQIKKKILKPVRKQAAKKTVAKKQTVKKPVAKKIAVKKSTAKLKPMAGMPGQLYNAAMKVLEDRQAEDIVSVDLSGRSPVADYVIIASGRASRQIAAIADYLRQAFSELGVKQIRVEGLPQANWVLVDAGDVVVHLFRPEVRRYYRIEDIWNSEDRDIENAALMLE